MTSGLTSCPSFAELADYWTSDTLPADVERIETHVFACTKCADLLADAQQLTAAIRGVAQDGAFQAFVTDGLLNQLSRDGVRVRTYTLDPGETIRCSAWSDDEVVVARLRANFTGVTAVDAEMRMDSGEQWGNAVDVPVRAGATELVLALPATMVRNAPRGPMRLTLRGSGTSSEHVIAEYVFNHEGAHDRSSR
jgi:hypothetical protein